MTKLNPAFESSTVRFSNEPLECIIRVPGVQAAFPGYRRGYRGNTYRNSQTHEKPVREFITGVGCHGMAVSKHILQCKVCTPADALPLVKATNFGSTGFFKRMLRLDPRTPRTEFLAQLTGIGGVKNLPWIVKFAQSSEELWATLVQHQERCVAWHTKFAGAGVGAAGRQNWTIQRWEHAPGKYGDFVARLASERCRQVPAERLELLRLAETLALAGTKLPSYQEALELLPVAAVHQA